MHQLERRAAYDALDLCTKGNALSLVDASINALISGEPSRKEREASPELGDCRARNASVFKPVWRK